MKSYPAYKNSGVPWLGEIPEHWGTKRAKYLFALLGRPVEPHHEVITCFRDGTVTLRKNRRLTGFTESLTEVGYQGVKKGDLVIHQMDAFAGAVGISDSDGKTTPVCSVCSSKVELSKPYFAYIIRRMASSNFILSLAKGIRQRSTDFRFATFARCVLPVPPLSEQAAIASYLDRKCGEIDEMVRRRQAIIERLRELKQALIAKAVTKGLHPDVPMKDSGIPWLGQIPEHWEMHRLGFICSKLNRTANPGDDILICSNNGTVYPRDENTLGLISDKDEMYQGVAVGDLLIHGMDTWHGAIAVSKHKGRCTRVVHVCESTQNKRLVAYFLQMLAIRGVYKVISNGVRGNTSDFRSWNKAKLIIIAYPPSSEEQQEIAAYLDKKCAAIDELISRHGQIVEKLKELKASAIAHVVTGKIDIRERA